MTLPRQKGISGHLVGLTSEAQKGLEVTCPGSGGVC